MFDVAALTIRRDLDLLEKKGLVERSHGGAVLRQIIRDEPSYSQKDNSLTDEKKCLPDLLLILLKTAILYL